ncbi:MAG: hypothetical protein ACREUV_00065 [Burkholderiales bacterium]
MKIIYRQVRQRREVKPKQIIGIKTAKHLVNEFLTLSSVFDLPWRPSRPWRFRIFADP